MQLYKVLKMERKSFATAPCSIARSLDILGDWWAPLIIRECLYGVQRFAEIQQWLGIGRNILTRRLKQLTQQGILEQKQYQNRPPRYAYHLTEKGYDAAKILLAMMPFGERWLFKKDHEPILLYDRVSQKRVYPVLVNAETGKPIDPRDLIAGPGPAFPEHQAVRYARFKTYYAHKAEQEG